MIRIDENSGHFAPHNRVHLIVDRLRAQGAAISPDTVHISRLPEPPRAESPEVQQRRLDAVLSAKSSRENSVNRSPVDRKVGKEDDRPATAPHQTLPQADAPSSLTNRVQDVGAPIAAGHDHPAQGVEGSPKIPSRRFRTRLMISPSMGVAEVGALAGGAARAGSPAPESPNSPSVPAFGSPVMRPTTSRPQRRSLEQQLAVVTNQPFAQPAASAAGSAAGPATRPSIVHRTTIAPAPLASPAPQAL